MQQKYETHLDTRVAETTFLSRADMCGALADVGFGPITDEHNHNIHKGSCAYRTLR